MRWLVTSHLIRIYTICNSGFDFRLKPLSASVDMSLFKDRRVQKPRSKRVKTRIQCTIIMWHCIFMSLINSVLTLKAPRKTASENVVCYVVCWIFLQTFQTYFCIQANSVDPDQTAPKGAVWSWSTLFAKMTFKIISRWQSRRQLLWLVL